MGNPQMNYPTIMHDVEEGAIEGNNTSLKVLPPVTIPVTANSDNIQGANEGKTICCCNTRQVFVVVRTYF